MNARRPLLVFARRIFHFAIPLRAARSKSRLALQRDDVSDVSGKNQLLDNGILSAGEANIVRENDLCVSLSGSKIHKTSPHRPRMPLEASACDLNWTSAAMCVIDGLAETVTDNWIPRLVN